jgi:hypothetical protein|tara:strand:- start:5004 stop:5765 length:762 start_codon:yes stop_codon:yes gene_type:complete
MLDIQNRIAINSLSGAGGLSSIITTYGFLNAWSSENLTINGTTTTAHDYLNEHDLSNPAAANQPSYSASDSDFNNKPSLLFDGVNDYLNKNTADWRIADSTGVFISVCRLVGGTTFNMLTSGDLGSANDFEYTLVNTNALRQYMKDGSSADSWRGTTVVNDNAAHVMASANSGSAYKIMVDSNNDAITMLSGTDDGDFWMDNMSNRDNITIAALVRNTLQYSNIEWCFSGYLPYVSDANIISLQDDLKTYYGI